MKESELNCIRQIRATSKTLILSESQFNILSTHPLPLVFIQTAVGSNELYNMHYVSHQSVIRSRLFWNMTSEAVTTY